VRAALFLAPRGRSDADEPAAAALQAEVSRFHALVTTVHAAAADLGDALAQTATATATTTSCTTPTAARDGEAAVAAAAVAAAAVAAAVGAAFGAVHGGAPRMRGQPPTVPAPASASAARALVASSGGGLGSGSGGLGSGSGSSSGGAGVVHALGSAGEQLARLVNRFCDALHNARASRRFGTTTTTSGGHFGSGFGGVGGGLAAGQAYAALADRLGDFFLKGSSGRSSS
jgi:hypothetical protein